MAARRASTGALTAPEIDVDRIHALGKAMFDDASFDWPREGDLSLKIARAMIAGVDAKQVDVDMRIDAGGVEIDRFAVADFGGATLAVKGRIDTEAQSPRGTITLDLDARSLDGITTAVARFAPQVAEELRRTAPQLSPMTLRASLAVNSPAAKTPNSTSAARFKADGRAGAFRLALQGEATAAAGAFTVQILELLKSANVKLTGTGRGRRRPAAARTRQARWLDRGRRSSRAGCICRRTARSTAGSRSTVS